MTKKFFVYGTLKVNGHFASQLNHLRTKVTQASINNFDLFGVVHKKNGTPLFPAAVKGTGKIEGEIHEFNNTEDALSIMDSIEGYDDRDLKNSLYLRKEVEVSLKDGSKEKVFIYLFNRKIEDYYPKMKEWVI